MCLSPPSRSVPSRALSLGRGHVVQNKSHHLRWLRLWLWRCRWLWWFVVGMDSQLQHNCPVIGSHRGIGASGIEKALRPRNGSRPLVITWWGKRNQPTNQPTNPGGPARLSARRIFSSSARGDKCNSCPQLSTHYHSPNLNEEQNNSKKKNSSVSSHIAVGAVCFYFARKLNRIHKCRSDLNKKCIYYRSYQVWC